jgi:hypothetical protein
MTLAPLIAAAPPAGTAPAPSSVAEARERFDRALKLYREGDFALALVEFRRAYELVHNYRVLYNIGQVSSQLGNYAVAWTSFHEYLARGGQEIPQARRQELARELRVLATRTGSLAIRANVAGANVFVDDVLVGSTPLNEPLLVDAGARSVLVRHPNYLPESRRITLAGGDRQELDITLEQRGIRTETVLVRDTSGGSSALLMGGWVATGVLAAGAAFTGVLGISASAELEDLRKQDEVEVPDLARQISSARSRARSFLVLSDVLTGAAVLAGGISLWLSLRPTPDHAGTADPKGVLRVGYQNSQLRVLGSF